MQHLDAGGNVIATDIAVGIETFIGSDADGIIYGTVATTETDARIHGADGDDFLYSGGAHVVWGGDDDDRVIVNNVDGPDNDTPFLYGGGGSAFADEIRGTQTNNVLDGNAGNDALYGRGGNAVLNFGNGTVLQINGVSDLSTLTDDIVLF